MRRPWVVLSVLALAFVLGAMPASAQTGIALSTSSTSGLTFTGTGSGNVSLAAGVMGSAAGLGGLLGTTGYYTLTGGPIALSLSGALPPVAVYTASGLLNFDITSLPGGGGTTLLKGTLQLVDLVQAFGTGTTNNLSTSDMVIASGTLAGDFPGATGISKLTINLGSLFLPSLPLNGAMSVKLGGATLDALPTPEPWTMLLYGSGLILIGFVLRRRLTGEALTAQA
jgi:hypothetical protein